MVNNNFIENKSLQENTGFASKNAFLCLTKKVTLIQIK